MIAKTYIDRNLRTFNRLYGQASSPQRSLFYSKLATLELCGWIEVSMDDIALRLARRTLRNTSHLQHFENEIVKKVYGFRYEQHFRRMLMGVIGLQGVATMERRVNQALFAPMCGALNALKPDRDIYAHQYIKGTTLLLDAPSVTINKFRIVYAGLMDVDRVLRRM